MSAHQAKQISRQLDTQLKMYLDRIEQHITLKEYMKAAHVQDAAIEAYSMPLWQEYVMSMLGYVNIRFNTEYMDYYHANSIIEQNGKEYEIKAVPSRPIEVLAIKTWGAFMPMKFIGQIMYLPDVVESYSANRRPAWYVPMMFQWQAQKVPKIQPPPTTILHYVVKLINALGDMQVGLVPGPQPNHDIVEGKILTYDWGTPETMINISSTLQSYFFSCWKYLHPWDEQKSDPSSYHNRTEAYAVLAMTQHRAQYEQVLQEATSLVVVPGDASGNFRWIMHHLHSQKKYVGGDPTYSKFSHPETAVEQLAETLARVSESDRQTSTLYIGYLWNMLSEEEKKLVQAWPGKIICRDDLDRDIPFRRSSPASFGAIIPSEKSVIAYIPPYVNNLLSNQSYALYERTKLTDYLHILSPLISFRYLDSYKGEQYTRHRQAGPYLPLIENVKYIDQNLFYYVPCGKIMSKIHYKHIKKRIVHSFQARQLYHIEQEDIALFQKAGMLALDQNQCGYFLRPFFRYVEYNNNKYCIWVKEDADDVSADHLYWHLSLLMRTLTTSYISQSKQQWYDKLYFHLRYIMQHGNLDLLRSETDITILQLIEPVLIRGERITIPQELIFFLSTSF